MTKRCPSAAYIMSRPTSTSTRDCFGSPPRANSGLDCAVFDQWPIQTQLRVSPWAGTAKSVGWNSAIVFPSGSLNHAELPTGVVSAWSTILKSPNSTRDRTVQTGRG